MSKTPQGQSDAAATQYSDEETRQRLDRAIQRSLTMEARPRKPKAQKLAKTPKNV